MGDVVVPAAFQVPLHLFDMASIARHEILVEELGQIAVSSSFRPESLRGQPLQVVHQLPACMGSPLKQLRFRKFPPQCSGPIIE